MMDNIPPMSNYQVNGHPPQNDHADNSNCLFMVRIEDPQDHKSE